MIAWSTIWRRASWPVRALTAWYAVLVKLDEDNIRSRRRRVLDLSLLVLFGLGIVALSGWISRWDNITKHPKPAAIMIGIQLVLYGLATLWVLKRKPNARWSLLIIVLIALFARGALIHQSPDASTDVYRYVWDGRIQSHTINPYRYPPNAPELKQYQDVDIYPNINRKKRRTIYPPVAETIFRGVYLIHPDSVEWTKLAFTLIDLVTILVIAGLLMRLEIRPERALLYAWHPLVILELGHSGHLDGVTVFFLLLAVKARFSKRAIWTGVLVAFATLTKLYAAVIMPALLRRGHRASAETLTSFVATIGLAYLPFLAAGRHVLGYLPGYLREEGIKSGSRFYLLDKFMAGADRLQLDWPPLPGLSDITTVHRYQAFVVIVMAGLAFWAWLAPRSGLRDIPLRALLLFTVFLVITTPTYPWYALLVLGFLPFVRGSLTIVSTAVVSLALALYLQWWWPGKPDWPLDIVYGGDALALGLAVLLAAGVWIHRNLRFSLRNAVRERRLTVGRGG